MANVTCSVAGWQMAKMAQMAKMTQMAQMAKMAQMANVGCSVAAAIRHAVPLPPVSAIYFSFQIQHLNTDSQSRPEMVLSRGERERPHLPPSLLHPPPCLATSNPPLGLECILTALRHNFSGTATTMPPPTSATLCFIAESPFPPASEMFPAVSKRGGHHGSKKQSGQEFPDWSSFFPSQQCDTFEGIPRSQDPSSDVRD